MIWEDYLPKKISNLYEVHDYHHAAAIFSKEFPNEFQELCDALAGFRFSTADVKRPGGSESAIPKNFSKILRPLGWVEQQLHAKVVVDEKEVSHDSHKMDYIKGRVAFDLEWNSKDQTYDRDLNAFRIFFAYDKISLGVLVTRSNELDPWIKSLGSYIDKNGVERQYFDKYGKSTTQMSKLLPRLKSGINGGCPVLVLGITTKLLQE